MIATSRTVKVLAVSAAALLHGAALWGVSATPDVEIEGANAAPEVSLGNSFADMAAGTMTAQAAETATEPVTPVMAEATPAPDVTQRAEPAKPQPAQTPTHAPPVVAETPRTAQPSDFAARVPVTGPPPEPTPEAAEPLDPVQPATVPDTASTAVTRSLRPRTRSATFEKEHETKPAPKVVQKAKPKKTKKKQAKAQPKGNARQNAKAGSASGQAKAKTKSASSGQARKKKANGNAAASNYPGKVMRKIARVPKPRVGAKGAAVVAFTISANGGLSAVSLARSSGSGQLDKAALRVVRKAAPFPPPPSGARRSFSIKIKGG